MRAPGPAPRKAEACAREPPASSSFVLLHGGCREREVAGAQGAHCRHGNGSWPPAVLTCLCPWKPSPEGVPVETHGKSFARQRPVAAASALWGLGRICRIAESGASCLSREQVCCFPLFW